MLRHPESGQHCVKAVVSARAGPDPTLDWQPNTFVDTACSRTDVHEDDQVVGYAVWFDDSVDPSTTKTSDVEGLSDTNEPDCLNKEADDAINYALLKASRRILRGRRDVWRKSRGPHRG